MDPSGSESHNVILTYISCEIHISHHIILYYYMKKILYIFKKTRNLVGLTFKYSFILLKKFGNNTKD